MVVPDPLAKPEPREVESEEFAVSDPEEIGTEEPEGLDGDVLIELEPGERRGSAEPVGTELEPGETCGTGFCEFEVAGASWTGFEEVGVVSGVFTTSTFVL